MKYLFYFLFLFSCSSLFSVETICKEYPELQSFFNSEEYKKVAPQDGIKILDTGKNGPRGGSTRFELRGMTPFFGIVFTKNLIDKNLLTAEEFKFILCHELGHINDPNLFKKNIAGIVTLKAAEGLSVVGAVWSLYKYRRLSPCLCFAGAALLCAGELLVKKIARDGEYFADRYGRDMTGNQEAALSALRKRHKMVRKKDTNLPDFLVRLLDDHPTEDERIQNLTQGS